jgi:thiamine biosynthesis lipoprotein ApbE
MRVVQFRSMGCRVTVAGAAVDKLAAIQRVFSDWDRVFSRFHAGSELNHVNACSGRIVRVSRLFSHALSTALAAGISLLTCGNTMGPVSTTGPGR